MTPTPDGTQAAATTQSDTAQDPQGIDGPRLRDWVARTQGADPTAVGFEVLSVGRSNLTFAVTLDGAPRWVLRRPPLGHTGGSAHDVQREGRIMAALGPTDVPVPTVLAIVDEPDVLEVPFVFQDHCPGFTIHAPDDLALIPESGSVRGSMLSMVRALASVHAVDVDEVGLGDLRRPGGFVERQLRRWLGQFEAITTRDLPIIAQVQAELSRSIPEETTTGLVHGDVKPNNMLFDRATGGVQAIVDWELSSIGDVVTDLGYLLSMMFVDDAHTGIWTPSVADGSPTADEIVREYASLTGRDTSDVPYYAAFAVWKLACIREGVYTRLKQGRMGDLDVDPEQAGASVEALAASALDILRDGRI
jgi:aminoglycoside phosphotransferase (APT) family kinase protein